MRNEGKYVIEIIGSKNIRYILRKVVVFGVIPVDGKVYATEKAARDAAKSLGLEVVACGDLWHII